MAGVYYDDPATTAAALLTADICVVLPQGLAVNETRRALPLSVKFLGGGHEAVVTHRGPYETLSSTYVRSTLVGMVRGCFFLFDWLVSPAMVRAPHVVLEFTV